MVINMNLENGVSEENKTKIATTTTAAKIQPVNNGRIHCENFLSGCFMKC